MPVSSMGSEVVACSMRQIETPKRESSPRKSKRDERSSGDLGTSRWASRGGSNPDGDTRPPLARNTVSLGREGVIVPGQLCG